MRVLDLCAGRLGIARVFAARGHQVTAIDLIEPPEIHGVRGFEIRLTPDRARRLGHSLIGAATQAMPVAAKTPDIG